MPKAKLTEGQVREIILADVRRGEYSALAAQYGVSVPAISYIRRGLRWKRVWFKLTMEALSG